MTATRNRIRGLHGPACNDEGFNVLSLFSGVGGLELGLERAGMSVVGQVEIDEFCRRVLAKHWPEVPRHDDVRTCVEWWRGAVRPAVDLICGGFPCQPVSTAGKGLAQQDERWLWPAFAGVIRDLRPRWVLLENVPGLLGRGAGDVLGDLAACGYDAEWDCISAADVGALHLRRRWFAVAYPHGESGRLQPVVEPGCRGAAVAGDDGAARVVADSASVGRGQGRPGRPAGDGAHREGLAPEELANAGGSRPQGPRLAWAAPDRTGWPAEPDVGRVADGVPSRVDRLRGLGNAVVPQVSEHLGRLILSAEGRAA
jgi:DNA (cytosine-5)-methyltransferase 1